MAISFLADGTLRTASPDNPGPLSVLCITRARVRTAHYTADSTTHPSIMPIGLLVSLTSSLVFVFVLELRSYTPEKAHTSIIYQ